MKSAVVLRDEARVEFDEAFDFYENQKPGSGVIFASRVQDVFDRIAANPEIHAVVFADIRKAVVKRSPYRVFYRAEALRIEVIAVFHTARNPLIWQGRA